MKTVIANWKMNGSRKLIEEYGRNLEDFESFKCNVILCPPFVYLENIINCFRQSSVKIGAQNCGYQNNGALTGEVSCEILTDIGCRYVIIAHSERRQFFHEKNDEIAKKMRMALDSKMTPVLCVGESAEQRSANDVEGVLRSQLEVLKAVKDVSLKNDSEDLIIAYEPVWAIGTGVIPTLQQIRDTHAFIKSILQGYFNDHCHNIKILYGGSVKPANAKQIFELDLVDGGLIRGASLDVTSFKKLCTIASVGSI